MPMIPDTEIKNRYGARVRTIHQLQNQLAEMRRELADNGRQLVEEIFTSGDIELLSVNWQKLNRAVYHEQMKENKKYREFKEYVD
jgi:hypothetical protein